MTKGVLQSVLGDMTDTQIDFVCKEISVGREEFLGASEERLDDIYDILCDIECEEIPCGDQKITERCKLASDIVTLWGNAIAESEGYFCE